VVSCNGFLNCFLGIKLMELGISRNCGTLELGRCQGKNFNSTPKKTSNTGLNTMTEKEQVSTALSELKKMVMYEEFGQN